MSKLKVNKRILDLVYKKNSWKYNLHKASEEFQELALVLNQKLLKPMKVDDQEIIDEIGDCIFRLEILKKMYDNKLIQKRIDSKCTDYSNWISTNKYKYI